MLKIIGKLLVGFVSLAIIGVSLLLFFRQDDVIDWYLLRDYEPSSEIRRLAEDTTMTELGQRYFYVYDPQLLSRETFRQNCTVAEKSIILGCYVSRSSIYIFDVTEERLSGVRQVTAAHEMLHVAYERLSSAEQERIDALNLELFDSLEDDRVKQTVESYRERDPAIVANELHSILPTEVRQLNPELEEYYAQYFENRLQVVEYSENYASVFESARSEVQRIDDQLQNDLATIKQLQTQLEADAAALERQREQLAQLLEDDQTEAYNNGIREFNRGVQAYNADVARLGDLIDRYNRLVAERNDAALAHEALVDSIDSGPATVQPESGI